MNLNWLNGLLDLPWWGNIVAALILTHITIASVTIFLHRHQAHRALDLGVSPDELRELLDESVDRLARERKQP